MDVAGFFLRGWPRRLVRCHHAAQLERQEFEFTHVLLLLKLVLDEAVANSL